jgi:glycosyltransferase involved in cell wall biosynthesis
MPADGTAPRITIGMPVYNGEQFLRQAVDSLLDQTYRNFELIICDNCSMDATEDICRSYAAADKRVRYHRNASNIGAPRNFNLAFSLSNTEYFKWAGADDICAPDLLERCVEILDRQPDAVLCYPKTTWIDENSAPIKVYDDQLSLPFAAPHQRLSHLLWSIRQCNANFGLIRSRIMNRTELFGSFPNSDVPFLAELALYGKFVEVPEPLFFRRVHSLSVHRYPTAQQRMVIFDPGSVARLTFPNWQLFGAYFSAIHRVPIGFAERLRCYARMHIWLRRWGSSLWQDVAIAARFAFRSRPNASMSA